MFITFELGKNSYLYFLGHVINPAQILKILHRISVDEALTLLYCGIFH